MDKVPVLLAIAVPLLYLTEARANELSLVELFEQGRITMVVSGTGVYEGESVKVDIANTSARAFRTRIPPGWRFVSERGPVQDLIVVREELIALAGQGRTTMVCRAFCCEASGDGPEEGERYKRGGMAELSLVTVAQAIASANYHDDLAQHAIWTVSDAHDIASMGALTGTAEDSLRMVVSRISGQPAPLYSMRFADEEGVVCTGRPAYIERSLDIALSAGATLTVVVIDRYGSVAAVLYDHEQLTPGLHTLRLEADVLDWPPGRYAFRAHTSDQAGVHRLPFEI
jgi:hypothetical protein